VLIRAFNNRAKTEFEAEEQNNGFCLSISGQATILLILVGQSSHVCSCQYKGNCSVNFLEENSFPHWTNLYELGRICSILEVLLYLEKQ